MPKTETEAHASKEIKGHSWFKTSVRLQIKPTGSQPRARQEYPHSISSWDLIGAEEKYIREANTIVLSTLSSAGHWTIQVVREGIPFLRITTKTRTKPSTVSSESMGTPLNCCNRIPARVKKLTEEEIRVLEAFMLSNCLEMSRYQYHSQHLLQKGTFMVLDVALRCSPFCCTSFELLPRKSICSRVSSAKTASGDVFQSMSKG